jgi:hypothetical protein
VGRDYELRDRTKQFALRIIRLFTALSKTTEPQVLGKQLLRSGTSVAANYREACRARSDAELISKLGIPRLSELKVETEELLRMTVSSIKTLKSR